MWRGDWRDKSFGPTSYGDSWEGFGPCQSRGYFISSLWSTARVVRKGFPESSWSPCGLTKTRSSFVSMRSDTDGSSWDLPWGPSGQNTKQKDWLPGQSQQAAQIQGACSTCSPGEGLQVPVETSSLTHADQRLIQPCVSTSATCQHSLWAGPTQVAAFTGSQPTILQQGQIRIPRESLQDFRTPISFYLQSYAQIPLKEGGLGQAWAEPVLSKASEHPKRLFKWLHQTKFIS